MTETPSTPEIVLLTFVLLASAGGFFWRFGPILKIIAAAKAEPGYSLRDWPRRIGRFVWEVMLQAKVVRERPLPGLAHAFVFWGFCAFGLVTLDHVARGYGGGFLTHTHGFGRVYFAIAAAFAAATAVSIAGLFWRRFVVRPKWLGEQVSVESGIIAGLIFVLMLTYLWDWWLVGEGGKANWWAHTLALAIFLPLIPHTKHLHLVLSPVAVAAMREGFSAIPPLEGEEDFGLVTGKDLTQVVALQAFSCVECGRCTEHCPAANTGKELNPKEIALGAREYLKEFGPASEEPLLGKHLSEKAVFQCTTCGACEYQCPVGVQHLPLIVGLRRGAVNTGSWEDDYGGKLFRNLERQGNVMGLSGGGGAKSYPLFDGTQEYCLWLGCMGQFDARGREIVEALVKVMGHLGVSYGVLKKEKCTGDPARRLGNDLAFGELAHANLESLSKWGERPPKVISICPHCVRTMAVDWREYGATPQVEHHTQFLARHAARLPKPAGQDVVYHDPCYLGRYQGIYDEPRQVLGGPREAERNRERSFCCGAGGGLAFLGEEEGMRVNETRARELAATGAAVIATGCPFCQTMFQAALTQIEGTGPKPQLKDVVELVAERLG
ncbi:MAG: (Fe-S)-binding protein [Bryobacter sp.]